MTSTRRSLLKMGLAGLFIPQASFALANEKQSQSFEAWRREFEAGVPARMTAAKVVGASVAICSSGSAVRYASSFGFADLKQQRPLTVDTPIHLASVSKLFTASALVQLFERHGLDLHDDINGFIDFPVRNPHHLDLPITPHQLLTHTSSISDEGYGDYSVAGDPTQSLSSFLRDYLVKGGSTYSPNKSFLKAKPGKKWSYCNVAVALAGYVVESVSKQSFSSYVEANIFEPLGIQTAHWYLKEFAPDVLAKPYRFEKGAFTELPQEGYPDVPAGMLRCSVTNLAKSLHAMLGRETGAKAILSPHAVAEMLRRQVDPKIASYQGLGWIEEEINGHKFVGHSGSDNGASNMVILTKDQTYAIAVLMNIDGTPKTEKFRASMIEDLIAGTKLLG
ncbi:serine hydrolase domain-containing protein [Mesorhizobium shangrilense]|uniref:Serine hydrolase domain-containing protein n=2 Tax=Mesorhizobium shangrilense TaxID=460060 RepID=A0ABV2DMT9_9HYPH